MQRLVLKRPAHATPEEIKNATKTFHFGFVFDKNLGREITWLSSGHRFQNAPFSIHKKTKSQLFHIPPDWRAGWKAQFSWRISTEGRPYRKNNASYSNFFAVVWRALWVRLDHVTQKRIDHGEVSRTRQVKGWSLRILEVVRTD